MFSNAKLAFSSFWTVQQTRLKRVVFPMHGDANRSLPKPANIATARTTALTLRDDPEVFL